jgi:hypothetical protein
LRSVRKPLPARIQGTEKVFDAVGHVSKCCAKALRDAGERLSALDAAVWLWKRIG